MEQMFAFWNGMCYNEIDYIDFASMEKEGIYGRAVQNAEKDL